MPEQLKNQLILNEKALAIWGLGYLGYTNIMSYANRGIRVIATDFGDERDRIGYLETHRYPAEPLHDLFSERGFSTVAFENVVLERDHGKLLSREDVAAHILCLPGYITRREMNLTEDKESFFEFLIEQKECLRDKNMLFVIESMMTPGATDSDIVEVLSKNGLVPGKDFSICSAPRRDWSFEEFDQFNSRIISGTDTNAWEKGAAILSLVCSKVKCVPTLLEAELAANIENALIHLQVTNINQVFLAYPKVDIKNLMFLLSEITDNKSLYSSLGTGGRRMAFSSMNILDGASDPDQLTLIKEAVYTDFSLHKQATTFIESKKPEKIGIMGLSYVPDAMEEEFCPVLKIVETLKASSYQIEICDPNFPESEIKKITGCDSFKFPDDLDRFDLILLFTAHMEFRAISWENLKKQCRPKWILDNSDAWKKFDWQSIDVEYKTFGHG